METSGRGWKWRKAGARILYRSAACRSTTDMWACGKHGPHVSGPTSPSVRQRSRVQPPVALFQFDPFTCFVRSINLLGHLIFRHD